MDRDRDRSYRFDRGESYRPADHPPRSPRTDTRANRSPFRNRSPPRPAADTWVPSNGRPSGRPRSRSPTGFRRSSRSPCFRGRDTGVGFPRTRSPPRRFSPRREERQWSPSRVSRRSRSPYGHPPLRSPRPLTRARSPPLKRGRDPSPPVPYNNRSPKRERLASPTRGRYDRPQSPSGQRPSQYASRGGFDPPSRTLVRREQPRDPYDSSWRRRSPSPVRSVRPDQSSGQGSAPTSRRPSPPTRPEKLNLPPSMPAVRSPTYASSRAQNESRPPLRSPTYRIPSPARPTERYQTHIAGYQPSRRGRASHLSPPGRQLSSSIDHPRRPDDPVRHAPGQPSRAHPPLTQPYHNGHAALPLSGPQINNKAASPPAGPSAAPTSISGPTRTPNLSLLSAPTRPKGGPSFKRDIPREGSAPSISRPGPIASTHHPPPTGPRNSFGQSTPNEPHRSHSFRHNTSSSNTYPRSQRFTSHLSGGPVVIPGGKLLLSGLDPSSEKRLTQLELDKEKLLEQIAEKQKVKRAGLRDWDRLDRESATSALRSELADGHLQRMVEGDGVGGGVAF